MGWVCGTYGRQERFMHGFGVGSLRARVHLENLGVDGRILTFWRQNYLFLIVGHP